MPRELQYQLISNFHGIRLELLTSPALRIQLASLPAYRHYYPIAARFSCDAHAFNQ